MEAIKIRGRDIRAGNPAYIIAEMSGNHNQDFNQAVKIIEAASRSGADAVKLQTYTADTLTIDCDNEYFRIKKSLWEGRTLYDLYGEAHTPWEWQPELKRIAESLGMDLFSTPFDSTSVDFLEGIGVPAYKVASFEIVDLPLLRKIASTGKPVFLSTGMASLGEIDEAVQVIRQAGGKHLALLKCTSAYPAPIEEANLRTIPHLSQAFDVPVGLSDHTLGLVAPVTAVTLGACIVEKHFTLSRSVPGPDNAFSMEPEEFKAMVNAIREAEKALGEISYEATENEKSSKVFRRSLFVVEPMGKGEEFTEKNVRSIRPGYGLHPRYLEKVLGRRATQEISKGTPLEWSLIG